MTREQEDRRKSSATKSTAQAKKVSAMVRGMIDDAIHAHDNGKHVAYAFVNGPDAEIMRAMDMAPIFTENYASVCAAKHDARRFLERAEQENLSASLCTYATCCLGFDAWREELGGMPPEAPWGGLPRPDVMIGIGTMWCDPRVKWFQAAQHYMPDVPVYMSNVPWPQYEPDYDSTEVLPSYVKLITSELHGLVEFLEKHTHKKMDWDRLAELVDLSDRTWNLWYEAYDLRMATPAPMGIEDGLNASVPGTCFMGTPDAYQFFKGLYDEIKDRVDQKKGMVGVSEEKYRLLWVRTPPPWHCLNIFDYFKARGAVFPVEDVYRHVEPVYRLDLPKTSDPIEHVAWRFIKCQTYWYDRARQRGGVSFPDVERQIQYIKDFKCDGIVGRVSSASCRRAHANTIWAWNVLKKIIGDMPSLLLEVDIVDDRGYSEADMHSRIEAFIDSLESARNRREC